MRLRWTESEKQLLLKAIIQDKNDMECCKDTFRLINKSRKATLKMILSQLYLIVRRPNHRLTPIESQIKSVMIKRRKIRKEAFENKKLA